MSWESLATINARLQTIGEWPGRQTPHYQRGRSPFTRPIRKTMAQLARELAKLSAKNVIVQAAFREGDLRNDGLPRAGKNPEHAGIIISFDSKYGPMRIYHDAFSNWEGNIAAIAEHLEHLRMASLYGVGKDGEQYRGWKALPNHSQIHFKDKLQAASVLLSFSGETVPAREIIAFRLVAETIYRKAAARAHPDSPGGSHDQFLKVKAAIDYLWPKERVV